MPRTASYGFNESYPTRKDITRSDFHKSQTITGIRPHRVSGGFFTPLDIPLEDKLAFSQYLENTSIPKEIPLIYIGIEHSANMYFVPGASLDDRLSDVLFSLPAQHKKRDLHAIVIGKDAYVIADNVKTKVLGYLDLHGCNEQSLAPVDTEQRRSVLGKYNSLRYK